MCVWGGGARVKQVSVGKKETEGEGGKEEDVWNAFSLSFLSENSKKPQKKNLPESPVRLKSLDETVARVSATQPPFVGLVASRLR